MHSFGSAVRTSPFSSSWPPNVDEPDWNVGALPAPAARRLDAIDDDLMEPPLSSPAPPASFSTQYTNSDLWPTAEEIHAPLTRLLSPRATAPTPLRTEFPYALSLSPIQQLASALPMLTERPIVPGVSTLEAAAASSAASVVPAAVVHDRAPLPAATIAMASPIVVNSSIARTSSLGTPVWSAIGVMAEQPALNSSAKRAKHRAIDAKRRNLEAEAMQTLQRLVMEPVTAQANAASHSAASAGRTATPVAASVQVPKVSLLQTCAEYIRQLQVQVQQLRLQASISASESSSTASSSAHERGSHSSERKRKRDNPQAGQCTNGRYGMCYYCDC